MNTKTTLMLAIALAALGGVYFILQARPTPKDDELTPSTALAASAATRDVFDQKIEDVSKVAVKRKDGEEWEFVKEQEPSETTGQAAWRMTKPFQAKCASWEIDRFGRQLGDLKYDISYKPGGPGAVTAEQAGLAQPAATITLADAKGQSMAVEIGNPAPNKQTYVRKTGDDVIYVAKTELRTLLKDRAVDYRDRQLWNFAPGSVTRVEIDDRTNPAEPMHYVFARADDRWMIESPVAARATSKIDDLLNTMARMSALKWEDGAAASLATYGLDPAALTVRATVEEEVSMADQADDAKAEKPETTPPKKKTTVYVLHVSDRSPIGEDTKVYARADDEHAVASVMKSIADKFKPAMTEWRDMRLTTAKIDTATRVELILPEGSAVLIKKDGAWLFDPDGGRAEASEVSDLLSAIGKLAAVTFVDASPTDEPGFGLNRPQVQIRLTIPGADGFERIAVGGYTDEQTKRLIYVRRNEAASVAKVRAEDVKKLLQEPTAYRDRTIVEVLPSLFERIVLSTENPYLGGRTEITLTREGNSWSMSAPVNAKLKEDQVDKLVEHLGGLRAERVVTDAGEASAYGLDAPSVTVALTFKPPVEYRVEKGEGEEKAEPIEVQPPSETIELAIARHDGKYYAKRADRPTIYEVVQAFHEQLTAEYRTDRVLEFDDTKVTKFSVRKGEITNAFESRGEKWVCEAEPDLPLDAAKVRNLLIQIQDLRTDRYVVHDGADFAALGLSSPTDEIDVTMDDGTVHRLLVSSTSAKDGSAIGVYAAVAGRTDAFVLTHDALKRFAVSLDELEMK